MGEVAKFPGLMRRGTKWYLRVRVPDDVVGTIGKKEIWKSLGTGDHGKAKALYLEERARLERQFARAREGSRALTGSEARRLVGHWLDRADRERALSDFGNLDGDAVRLAREEADVEAGMLLSGRDDVVLPEVQSVADSILLRDGWPRAAPSERTGPIKPVLDVPVPAVDKSGEGYRELCSLVHRALVEMVRRQRARLDAQPAGTHFDPEFAGTGQGQHSGRRDVTLSGLVERFLSDPTREAGAKANHDYEVVLRMLGEFVPPHTPARDVTRDHCRQVAALLKRMPANASKKPEFRSLRPLEAAAEAERLVVPPMSPTTANSYISKMSALFKWAAREGFVPQNPAEKLMLPEGTHKRDARLPFSSDQLNQILEADLYKEPRGRWDHRQWVFLLGLFMGLRLNEACTLECADVVVREGVDVVLVQPDEQGVKKLKTRAARRTVPLHPVLTDLGFLDFARQQRDAGHARLFPSLKPDRRGYYSDAFQKWFGRHLKKIGADAPRTTFHSTRHNFRDALREAGVGRDAVLALGGWSAGGIEEVYGGGLRPATLAEAVAKVGYPGLDLSHLRKVPANGAICPSSR